MGKTAKKKFVVIWWRNYSREWRIDKGADSVSIATDKVADLFKTFRVIQKQKEYFRVIYQLEQR